MKIKKIVALSLVCLQLMSAGCSQYEQTTRSPIANQGTAGGLVDQLDVVAEEDLRTTKEIYQDLLDRDYANGLYYEDYSEVEEQLNEEFRTYYANAIENDEHYYGDPYVFVSHLTFYKQTLKDVSEGVLTLDDIMGNILLNVKMAEMTECHFTEGGKCPLVFFPLEDLFREELGKKETDDLKILRVAYDRSVLEKIPLEQLKAAENPYYELLDKAMPKYILRVSAKDVGGVGEKGTIVDEALSLVEKFKKDLKAKYNEDFIFKGKKERLGGSRFVWAPATAPDFEFEQTWRENRETYLDEYYGDRYLDALSQKYLSVEVNKILEEEGVADRFVQYVAPHYHEDSIRFKLGRDTSNIVDPIAFLKDYSPFFQLSLIYLKHSDEEIDYEMVRRVSERMLQLFSKNNEDEDLELFVQFYNLDVDWQPAIDLFKRDVITEGDYKPDSRTLLEYSHLLDADTEAFKYLQVYGEKLDFILNMRVAYPERSLEDFIRLNKQRGPWGD